MFMGFSNKKRIFNRYILDYSIMYKYYCFRGLLYGNCFFVEIIYKWELIKNIFLGEIISVICINSYIYS